MNEKEIEAKLKARFEPEQIEWRPQLSPQKARDKGQQLWLPYVTARAVMDRLDECFGPFGWSVSFERYSDGALCKLTAAPEGRAVHRQDAAPDSDIEPLKGGISGAFKRAAVHFGIGRYLYDEDPVWLPLGQKPTSGVVYDSPPARPAQPQQQRQAAPAAQQPTQPPPAEWRDIVGDKGPPPPSWLEWTPWSKKKPGYTFLNALEEYRDDTGDGEGVIAWAMQPQINRLNARNKAELKTITDAIDHIKKHGEFLDVDAGLKDLNREMEEAGMVEPSAEEMLWGDNDNVHGHEDAPF